MKKVILVLALFAIAFAFSGCSDSSITGLEQPNQVTDKSPVPFKGKWEGMTYMTGVFTRLIECQGNCTHLGLFDAVVTYDVTYTDPEHPEYGGGIQNGVATMTAANGDKLYLENLTGTWGFISNVNPMVGFSCTCDINGGTGRFLNATGSFTGEGIQNFYPLNPLQPQEVWFNWNGTINY
jgi:hypothetical protein